MSWQTDFKARKELRTTLTIFIIFAVIVLLMYVFTGVDEAKWHNQPPPLPKVPPISKEVCPCCGREL